jgi:hypothetical protein
MKMNLGSERKRKGEKREGYKKERRRIFKKERE